MFLTAVVSVLAPGRVIELGTASGFSAAVIAAALARQGVAGARVDTIDLHPRYYADSARPVGYAVEELVPALLPMVRVHMPHGADFATQIAGRDTIGLAFIDANHQHPCPVLDLLLLAPVEKSGGWVLLHDVRLGTLGREAREAGRELAFDAPFGAEWLYEEWPWRKFRGQNIGAIQLPDDKAALIAVALQLMARPFETSPGSHRGLARDLYGSFPALLL
jgi:predicted O-methyltransferase YrrM